MGTSRPVRAPASTTRRAGWALSFAAGRCNALASLSPSPGATATGSVSSRPGFCEEIFCSMGSPMLALLWRGRFRNDLGARLAAATRGIFGGKMQQGLAVDALRRILLPVALEAPGGEEQSAALPVEVALGVLYQLQNFRMERRLRIETFEVSPGNREGFPGVVEVARGDHPLVELAPALLVRFSRRLGISRSDCQHLGPDLRDRPRPLAVRLDEGDDVSRIGPQQAVGKRQGVDLFAVRGPRPGEMLSVEPDLEVCPLDGSARLVMQDDAPRGAGREAELDGLPAFDLRVDVPERIRAGGVVQGHDRGTGRPAPR